MAVTYQYDWLNLDTNVVTHLHSWSLIGVNYRGYAVMRQGISGFSSDMRELSTAHNMNSMGEYQQCVKWNRRDNFGFNIAIMGAGRIDIDDRRKVLISELSHKGQLIIIRNGVSMRINVEKAVLSVQDGLQENPKVQYGTISFTALSPYFYGDAITKSGITTAETIDNKGNMTAELTITLSANTVTRTCGSEVKTITSVDAQTALNGVVLNVKDNSVSAVLSGTNAMSRFAITSEFFMLEPGTNVISGISAYTYTPRWSGI